jgi:hypothetical protein
MEMEALAIKYTFGHRKNDYTISLTKGPEGIPILIGDRINNPQIPQYYDSQGDSPYCGKRRITLSAAEAWNSEARCSQIDVAAMLVDEDGLTGNGYTYSRCLYSEWVTQPEEVVAAIERALEAVQVADLTPEWTRICERYAERDALLAAVPPEPTRAEYEAACARFGCEPLLDDRAAYFSEQYSGYAGRYHALSALEMAITTLHIRYGRPVAKQIKVQRQEQERQAMSLRREPPKKQGQLWEPCPNCGREPVYMPLHLCEGCWEK